MAATNEKALQTVPAILEVAAYPAVAITALAANNSNAAAVIADIEGKVSSWSRVASITDLAITRNIADGLTQADTDDNGIVFSGSRAKITVKGNWFEEGDLDSIAVILGEPYVSVAASPVTVTAEAHGTGWTQGAPFKLTNKNGDNLTVGSIVVKEDSVALVLNTDYRTFVGDGDNGDLGFTYITPITAQAGVITVDYAYTPSATRYTGLDTAFRELPRLVARITTVADADGDVDTHYIVDAVSTGDLVKNLVNSARAGDVKNTPFELSVNNGGFLVSAVERF